MTVHKEICERYLVSHNGERATISLSDWTRSANEGRDTYYCGEIMIHSSFGNWGHTWTACAEPFKAFLLGVEFDYMFTKFMGNDLRRFDGARSFNEVQRKVIDERRQGTLNHDEARNLWNDLDLHRDRAESSLPDFVGAMYDASRGHPRKVTEMLSEPWEMAATKYDAQAEGFWRELWPEFTAALRAEFTAALRAELFDLEKQHPPTKYKGDNYDIRLQAI